MGWESRGGKNMYYTRSRRVDGRVVRTYFGCGPEAEAAAAEDIQRREQLQRERQQQAIDRAMWDAIEAQRVVYYEFVDLIVKATWLSSGYHYHRGQWRKRRGVKCPLCVLALPDSSPLASYDQPRPRRLWPQRPNRESGPGLIRNPFLKPLAARLRDLESRAGEQTTSHEANERTSQHRPTPRQSTQRQTPGRRRRATCTAKPAATARPPPE